MYCRSIKEGVTRNPPADVMKRIFKFLVISMMRIVLFDILRYPTIKISK